MAHDIHRWSWSTGRSRLAIATMAASLLAWSECATAQDEVGVKGFQFTVKEKGQQESYSWDKVNLTLDKSLKNAQQVNIYNTVCNSGFLIDVAKNDIIGLHMPWVIGASVKFDQLATYLRYDKDRTPPGRLKGSDGVYYASYAAFLTKYIQSAPASTVKQLHDKAAADVGKDPGLKEAGDSPQYGLSKTANDGMTLYGGTKASAALVFTGNLTNIDKYMKTPSNDLATALKNTNKFDSLQYYLAGSNQQGIINGPGTSDNWTAALKNLQTLVDANKGQVVVNLFLLGHSFESQANVTPAPDGIPGAARQGIVINNPGDGNPFTLDINMTPDFWRELEQDVTIHDPTLIRGAQPEFFLGVSESSMASSFGVAIDGLSVGTFFLGSNPDGGLLDIPLSDGFLANLIHLHGGDSSLELEFSLATSDTMRLALKDDIYDNPDYQFGEYGTGIKVVVAQTIPEPNTLLLAAIATVVVLVAGIRKKAT